MNNYVIVKNEDGSDIKIEVLFSFKVEEYNKEYIAYTINDDGVSEVEPVLISEYDGNNKKIISIPFEEKEFVLKTYEEVKKIILED